MIIIHMTAIKNIIHANKSWAKQSPATKYATLKIAISKSDIFVLCECSRSIIFIFEEYNI